MPLGDPWPSVQTLLRAEAAIRGGRVPVAKVWRLDPYWQDLARLLQVLRHFRKKEYRKIAVIRRKMVYPIYNEYIKKKETHPRTAPRSGQPELFSDENLVSEDESKVR
jgi:thymidylate synthase